MGRQQRTMLSELVRSATDSELKFVAELDYGVDAHLHLSALQRLIRVVEGDFTQLDEHCTYPREVIELGACWLQQGHEREFAICTLLWIHAIVTEADACMELQDLFDQRSADYQRLPSHLQDEIQRAFRSAGVEQVSLPPAQGHGAA